MDMAPALYLNKLPLAGEWLSRSGELPLSIFVKANGEFPTPTPSSSVLAPLIFFINEYAHRWQHLELDLPSPHFRP